MQTNCPIHGPQGIGLVCEHIALAVSRGERVGFFWGPKTDTARPDAWCSECEASSRALGNASHDKWFQEAEFKVFCSSCWDEAKAICGGFSN